MLSDTPTGNNSFGFETFLNQSSIELRRAERYRVFVTLIKFDLSVLDRLFPEESATVLESMVEIAQRQIRASDMISSAKRSIALLIPETPRQGAEITCRRLSELFRQRLSAVTNTDVVDVIPLEMASFPDTAGARTMASFLQDLADLSRN